jgi:thymidylate kinase
VSLEGLTVRREVTSAEPPQRPGDPVPPRVWLGALFAALERRGSRYACLRMDESLLRANGELDVLVAPGSLPGYLEEMRQVCRTYPHLKPVYWRVMPSHAATIILVWRDQESGWSHYFFDVRCGIRKAGRVLADGSALTPSMTVWDEQLGARRLRDELERSLLLARNEADGRDPSPRHLRILDRTRVDSGGAHSDATHGIRALSRWTGDPGISDRLTRSRRTVVYGVHALLGRVGSTGSGLNVVFYGPDGVGKTTQANLLAAFFRRVGVRKVDVFHHLTGAGGSLRAQGKAYSAKARVYQMTRGSATTSLLVTVSYLKKLLAVLFTVRPLLRKGHVVLHDRYLLDVFQKLLKSKGVRMVLPERLLPKLGLREPLVMVLYAPPEVILSRTGELSEDQVVASYDQLRACLGFAGRRVAGWTEIDATGSANDVHRRILDRVLEIQSARVGLQ